MVFCDNEKCEYQDEKLCTAKDVYYSKRLCLTFRKRKRNSGFKVQELMAAPFNPHCRTTSRGFKSTGPGKVLK